MKSLLFFAMILFIVAGIVYFRQQNKVQIKHTSVPTAVSPSQTPPATQVPQISTTQNNLPAETVIAENLDTPWAIAFLPDKSMLVTERPGRVRLVTSDGKLIEKPIVTLNQVKEIGEGGLLGIALHPDFAKNHYLYLYYTYSSNGSNTLNRVVRFTYADKSVTDETIIVDGIPGASNHDGGRIKFGPDKMLYISTGDSQEPSLAQDKNSLAGKILRVTADGKPAPGNPFGTRIYSYGHRNPQGLAFDAHGNLWETEHGRSTPTGYDEINLIQSGKNYGWPEIQGDETRTGMETPKRNSGATNTWAPSGATFLPAGRQGVGNSLFFAGLRGQTLYEAVTQNNQVTELKEHVKGSYGRLREVVLGPDGMLYITTSNKDGRGNPDSTDDKIIRINPKKL